MKNYVTGATGKYREQSNVATFAAQMSASQTSGPPTQLGWNSGFHGGNTGSSPVGRANSINGLQLSGAAVSNSWEVFGE
jgi:hypothetical protein